MACLSSLTFLKHLPMLLWPPAWCPPGLLPLSFSPFKKAQGFTHARTQNTFFRSFFGLGLWIPFWSQMLSPREPPNRPKPTQIDAQRPPKHDLQKNTEKLKILVGLWSQKKVRFHCKGYQKMEIQGPRKCLQKRLPKASYFGCLWSHK